MSDDDFCCTVASGRLDYHFATIFFQPNDGPLVFFLDPIFILSFIDSTRTQIEVTMVFDEVHVILRM